MTFETSLPNKLFSAEQVREIDRLAIEEHGINGFELMQLAARFSFHILLKQWPNVKSILVICGAGNNAGDGYIVAGLAQKRGIEARVQFLSDPLKLSGDAKSAYEFCLEQNVECLPFEQHAISFDHPDVIVDALLGTGINKEVTGQYREAIEHCNAASKPILAIDIPSGLSANTGQALGCAIKAKATATFIGLKVGQLTGRGKHFCGELYFDQLDVPEQVVNLVPQTAKRLSLPALIDNMPDRHADTHKGQCGHVLLIGGDHGYGGAILMAAEAAARMGAGLVTVATQAEHCPALLTRTPEVMVKTVTGSADLKPLLAKASTIVIGPGLGQSAWSQHMLFTTLSHPHLDTKHCVMDADALNLLCIHKEWLPTSRDNFVFTPHPGEAARLLKKTNKDIQADRIAIINELVQSYGGTFLLKGSGSLLKHPETAIRMCSYGNPGMATGGMGDVLSGILGGLLTQDIAAHFAIDLATCLHAKSADILAEKEGERGLLASDLIPIARQLLNQKLCLNQ